MAKKATRRWIRWTSAGLKALLEIDEIGLKIDLFDGPRVLDAVAEHVVEDGIAHGPEGEAEAGIEDGFRCLNRGHGDLLLLAGFAGAWVLKRAGDGGGCGMRRPRRAATVVLAMRVAGRERR